MDVQYELTRTRNSINNIKDEDIFIESKEISRMTGDPLALCDTMPIHNTRATTVTYWSKILILDLTLRPVLYVEFRSRQMQFKQ